MRPNNGPKRVIPGHIFFGSFTMYCEKSPVFDLQNPKNQIQYNQVTNCTRLEAQVQELYMGKFVSNPIGGVLKIRILELEGATCQSCRTFETAVVWTPSTVQLQSITMESPITTQLGNSKAESCIRVAANSFHRNSTLKQFVEGRSNVAIDRPHCANKVHHQALANREHQESWTANTPWCPQWQVERDAQQFFLESCLIRVSCTVAVYPKWYVGVSTRMVGAPCVTAASMVPKLAQRCFRNLDTKLVGKKKCQQWTNVEHRNRLFTLPQPLFGEVHQGLHIVNRLAFPGKFRVKLRSPRSWNCREMSSGHYWLYMRKWGRLSMMLYNL